MQTIQKGHVLTGAELNELSDEDFEKVVGQYSVYAPCVSRTQGSYRQGLAKTR